MFSLSHRELAAHHSQSSVRVRTLCEDSGYIDVISLFNGRFELTSTGNEIVCVPGPVSVEASALLHKVGGYICGH